MKKQPLVILGTLFIAWCFSSSLSFSAELPKADGYRGIWYMNQPQKGPYKYKYSGGLGTYCAKHRPFAIYSKEADKTFFCYGGTTPNNKTLLHMVSYFDHKTGMVPRPRTLVDKKTTDAHDNPVISMDEEGHILIVSTSHGTNRPSYLWVSKRPYDIDEFEMLEPKAFATKKFKANLSYVQPHFIEGKGFVLLLTRYFRGPKRMGIRMLYSSTSTDGREWTKLSPYAKFPGGQYQVSESCGNIVGTCFNIHPLGKGVNWRTNLYYMQTADGGRTWTTVDGTPLEVPVANVKNAALVHDYQAEHRNVYLKDINFDEKGRPVLLYITSPGWQAGPKNSPRVWCTAHWIGDKWDIQGSIESDNNYDMGSIYVEPSGLWRIIGPTEVGPQPFNPGGEVAMWTSGDQGHSWKMVKQLTRDSQFNHTYCRRPVNAHPDFYALWADGHGRKPSKSRLYFTNRDGDHVWRLPMSMESEMAKPEIAW